MDASYWWHNVREPVRFSRCRRRRPPPPVPGSSSRSARSPTLLTHISDSDRRAHRDDRHAAGDGQARQGHRSARHGGGDGARPRRPNRRGRKRSAPGPAPGVHGRAAPLPLATQDLSPAGDGRGACRSCGPVRVASADRRALRGRPARVAFEPRHRALSLARRPLRRRAGDPARRGLRRDGARRRARLARHRPGDHRGPRDHEPDAAHARCGARGALPRLGRTSAISKS